MTNSIFLIKKRLILIIIFLFFLSYIIYSERIFLNDGNIFQGKIEKITIKNLYFLYKANLYKINFNDIELILIDDINYKRLIIIIERNNGIKEKIYPIKITGKTIYYKTLSDNKLKNILIADLKNIYLNDSQKIDKNVINYKNEIEHSTDINIEIDLIVNKIYNKKRDIDENMNSLTKEDILSISRSYFININNDDFYENIWKRINIFLDSNTKNIIWNLLEQYSNKEKYLNIIINNNMDNMKEINKDIIINEINKLRLEFYYRIKKIIYKNEFLY